MGLYRDYYSPPKKVKGNLLYYYFESWVLGLGVRIAVSGSGFWGAKVTVGGLQRLRLLEAVRGLIRSKGLVRSKGAEVRVEGFTLYRVSCRLGQLYGSRNLKAILNLKPLPNMYF